MTLPPCEFGRAHHSFPPGSDVCRYCWLDRGTVYVPPQFRDDPPPWRGPGRRPKALRTPDPPRPLLADPCVYCGDPANSWDHILPRGRGGQNTKANRVPSCQPCNNAKGDRTPLEWLGRLCPLKWRGIYPTNGSIAKTRPKRTKMIPPRVVAHLGGDPTEPWPEGT